MHCNEVKRSKLKIVRFLYLFWFLKAILLQKFDLQKPFGKITFPSKTNSSVNNIHQSGNKIFTHLVAKSSVKQSSFWAF